jgi:hypothetical protein
MQELCAVIGLDLSAVALAAAQSLQQAGDACAVGLAAAPAEAHEISVFAVSVHLVHARLEPNKT